MVPIFLQLIIDGQNGWALGVFTIAGLTDMLDGWLARHLKQKSELGALLDPIADKVLLTSAFLVLTFSPTELPNRIPVWLTAIVISRDVLLVVCGILIYIATGYKNFPPTVCGKLSTFFQVSTVFVALIGNWRRNPLPFWDVLVYVTFLFTILSGLRYSHRGIRLIRRSSTVSAKTGFERGE
jgi:cardiolipin synthase